jgi:uncharacterized protein YndB with AHSA1/START domain
VTPVSPPVPDVELEFHTLLVAPPARVFAALTQADHLAHWLCDEAQSEPRGGGRVTLRWRRAGSSEQPFTGSWVAFDAPRACAFAGGEPSHPDGYAGRIEWTLEPSDGGTRLVTRHRMPPRVEYADVVKRYAGAWPRALERLAKYLTPTS